MCHQKCKITHLLIPHQLLHSNRWHAWMQFSMDKDVTRKSCSFHPFNGFLCNFLVFPLLIYGAPSGTTAEKVAVSILSVGFFAVFEFFLCFGALHRGKQLIKLQLPMRSCTIFLGKRASRWDQMFPQVSTHTQLACHFDAYLVSLLKTSHHQMAGFDDSRDIRCSYAIRFSWHIYASKVWPPITTYNILK